MDEDEGVPALVGGCAGGRDGPRSLTRLSLPISRMFSATAADPESASAWGSEWVSGGCVSGAGAEVSTGAAVSVRGWFSRQCGGGDGDNSQPGDDGE